MTFHYSDPVESLIAQGSGSPAGASVATARVVIIGSGYGGSVAAYRLSRQLNKAPVDRTYGIVVLERGREYAPGEFPERIEDLASHVQVSAPGAGGAGGGDALFDVHAGDGVDVLVGAGLGGTSLINANVALRPEPAVFASPAWPEAIRREMREDGEGALGRAYDTVTRLLGVATEAECAPLADLDKHRAFCHTAQALGLEARPAPVAVTLGEPGRPRRNVHGIFQPACTNCGNCITGCNVGAKNTLAMNLIPAAHAAGVKFCTGARVLTVEPHPAPAGASGPRWRIRFEPVSRETQAHAAGPFFIDADHVILAAGTLGSTDILARSARHPLMSLSSRLGRRFSTNGDFVAMSFGERERVSATGARDWSRPADCGPTITAVARGSVPGGGDARYTIEEGALPAGAVRLIGEAVTTAAQLGRIGSNRLPAWFRGPGRGRDPLATQPGAIEHSQVFLVMGRDGAQGSLRFEPGRSADDAGGIVPVWLAGEAGVIAGIDAAFRRLDRRGGLRGGQFVPSPGWRLLSATAGAAMSGTLPGGRLVTVHPLGGCPMGDSGRDGVVDHRGRVFRGDGDSVHEGLYVLDGAIVPDALGVNPFLTIAALAWRASSAVAEELAPGAVPASPEPRQPLFVPWQERGVEKGAIVIREQLLGALARTDETAMARLAAAFPGSARWFETDGLILRVATEPADTDGLVSGERPVRLVAKLYENPVSAADTRRMQTYGFPEAHLANARLVATGGGTVTIMAADEPGWLRRIARGVAALFAYFARRDSFWSLLFRQRAEGVSVERVGVVAGLRAFWQVALMHATYREFAYDLTLRPREDSDGDAITIRGTKRLAWRNDNDRLWPSMLRLPIEFAVPARRFATRGELDVDMEYLLDAGLLTVAPDAGVAPGVIESFALGGHFGRSILQVGFWEFGAPDYPEALPAPQPLPPAAIAGVAATTHGFAVPLRAGSDTLRLTLTRYGGNAAGEPVLLVHGLAQGSLIYAHTALGTSMARHFIDAGFDVWLLDCRLSNRFDERVVPYDGWTIDEIGAHDLPLAVHEIRRLRGDGRPVHVFAHCVGATAVAMAILDGHLDRRHLASVVLNAIHPWTIPSPANRVRAKLGVFFRDWLDDEFFDPMVPSRDRAGLAQSLLDRVAFSAARIGEDGREHPLRDDAARSCAICDRMTFLYGRMWQHGNVRAVHGHWRDLVGRAPSAVQRHLYYMLIHGRVLDHRGVNRYLTDDGVRRWRGIRTLFMHGDESDVFNAHSASRSAWRLHSALNGNGAGAEAAAPGTPVRLRRVPGFGHMDVILADTAAEHSFRYVEAFFRGEFDGGNTSSADAALRLDDYGPRDDPHYRPAESPETGPVLRAARIERGRLRLRYWAEAPGMNTSPPDDVEFEQPGRIVAEIHPDGVEPAYFWIDVDCRPEDYRLPKLTFPVDEGGPPFAAGSATAPGGFLTTRARPPARFAFQDEAPAAPPPWLARLVRRAAGEPVRDCHFLVGSCHYPGTPFDREFAHRAFEGMGRLLARPSFLCDALFMIGDQIYADATAGLLDPVAWRDRYLLRYREAFDAKAVQQVLQSLPVHFAVDDHEFADNYAGIEATRPSGPHRPRDEDWRTQAIRGGRLGPEEFAFALGAARSYMSSAREAVPVGDGPVGPTGLWYALDEGELGCPAFVLDTRSERRRAEPGVAARLMRPEQLDALLAWLDRWSGDPRPKFIFAGSVILPLSTEAQAPGAWLREDGLAGYPQELRRILAHIVERDIRGIVFLGGDLHLSCIVSMELQLPGFAPVRATQVVASGLYAPLAVANVGKRSIDWDREQTLEIGGCRVVSRPTLLTQSTSHFVRVSAVRESAGAGWTLRAEAYDHTAALLRSVEQEI
ncbi:MAG: GMC oxidoreductase [Steroidobacteraceae bacterium]